MSDEALRQIAEGILERLPPNAISPPIVEKLHAPTLAILRKAGMALLESGDLDSAEAAFRAVLERPDIPPWAAVGLARVAAARGDLAGAVAAWRDCFDRFPDRAEPHWFVQLARAERDLGRDEDAEATLRLCTERFRGSPAVLAARAEDAARAENWALALSLWSACLAGHGDSARPGWLNGRAKALFRLSRIEEAMGAWRALTARFPDFIPGHAAMAAANRDLGLWAEVQECWSNLIQRFPAHVQPEWLEQLARSIIKQRADPAANLVIHELERRFPESPLGCTLAIELAHAMNIRLSTLSPLIEDAVGRFPSDRRLMAEYVRVLLAEGRLSAAETLVRNLEAAGDDHFALLSRWRLLMDRDGEETIVEATRQAVHGHTLGIEPGLAIGDFLLDVWSLWATELALELYTDLAERFPGRATILCSNARTLIVLRRDDAAKAVIDSLSPASQHQFTLELRAWAAARRGCHEQSRQLWHSVLAGHYLPAVHAAEPTLELVTPERDASPPAEVTVFMAVKDELANLPEFLRHHRSLGIGRFVVVDNMSTDGTEAYLRNQRDVILYRTADDFWAAGSGMRWINTLIERHRGDWSLFVDADEAFIFPGWERLPLKRLLQYLDEEGTEAVAAFMLDVFPERLLDSKGRPARHADCRYYDDDHVWVGHVRPPFLRPLGGARTRLFKAQEYLHKVPLIKCGRGAYISNHETTPLLLSGVTGALLHYKFLALARRSADPNPIMSSKSFDRDYGPEVMRRYERYAGHLKSLKDVDLRLPGVTQSVTESLALAERGVMQAPPAFRRWLSGRGGGTSGSRPDG